MSTGGLFNGKQNISRKGQSSNREKTVLHRGLTVVFFVGGGKRKDFSEFTSFFEKTEEFCGRRTIRSGGWKAGRGGGLTAQGTGIP